MITLPETSVHTDNLRLPQGATIVLDNRQGDAETVCSDTPLSEARDVADGNDVPPRIYEMVRMYEYGNSSFGQKCLNFYRQGKFMEDYEDDAPWEGTFSRYFPTYHDLNIRQLRGYFTWRTQVRRGTYLPISTSLAYIYLYELLNGIGTTSVEESLWKMQEFETEFLDTEIGDPHMKHNLHRWMLELAIMHQIPKKTVLQYIESYHLQLDRDLETLRNPESRTDEEIFTALRHFAERRMESSPVFKKDEAAGKHLFAEIWKHTLATCNLDGKDLFTACFGPLKAYHWYPLANAVYLERRKLDDITYELNSCHRYLFTDGHWLEEKYGELYFHRNRIKDLLHVTDLKLRHYFGTGHHLRGNDLPLDPGEGDQADARCRRAPHQHHRHPGTRGLHR